MTRSSSSVVDWPAAARVAGRIAPPGPVRSRQELQHHIDDLRTAAQRAWEPAVAASGLGDILGSSGVIAPVFVLDRPGWAIANAESMGRLASPLLGELPKQTASAHVIGTVEAAGILALLSTKVLGQFDPYGPADGRLLLIAPNILEVQDSLGVPAADFRAWVCLHELTHAAQFQAAPWLANHIIGLLSGLGTTDADDTDGDDRGEDPTLGDLAQPGAASAAMDAVAGVAASVIRAGRMVRSGVKAVRGSSQAGLVDGLLSTDQQASLADLTAIMALLEGHADVTMDAVGPAVIPSVEQLRSAFEQRRDSTKGMAKVLSRLLGMEAKLAQYRNGATFVRHVQEAAGQAGLAAAWHTPENLPRADEIAEPDVWIRRVLG